jgi:glycine cleavage system aminomethyltransferase T
MTGDSFELEVMGKRVPATRLKEAPFDPKSARLRS